MSKPPKPPEEWFSTEAACAYLQVSPTFLRGECRRLKIQHQEIGRRYRFLRDWLDAWKVAHTRGEPVTKGAVMPGFGGTSVGG